LEGKDPGPLKPGRGRGSANQKTLGGEGDILQGVLINELGPGGTEGVGGGGGPGSTKRENCRGSGKWPVSGFKRLFLDRRRRLRTKSKNCFFCCTENGGWKKEKRGGPRGEKYVPGEEKPKKSNCAEKNTQDLRENI